jgi:hypothetical protein
MKNNLLNCFIEPNGKVHHVGVQGHALFICDYIIENKLGEDRRKYKECDLVEYIIETRKWIKISQWRETHKAAAASELFHITKKQKEALYDLLIEGFKVDHIIELIKD